jgi:hypothetical protein
MIGTSRSVWGFDPRSVPGCQLWLDGADSNTVTGTTSVTAWRDKSANGYVANSFVNSVPNPSWVPNVRNGNGVIQYSAGNGSSIANFVLAQTMSIFKVYYPINQGTNGPFLEHSPDTNTNLGFYFHANGGENFLINAGTTGYPFPSVNFGNTTVSNTWQLIQGINPDTANLNKIALYVNGTTRASGATQSAAITVTNTLYINGRAGANNLSYNTYLAELIIYNIAVTTTQRQQIEGYLAHKWGLTGYYDSSIPLSIPGCQLWLDAADSSTVAFSSGSNISSWTNKGIVSTTATPTRGASANQITYVTVSGYPGVYINNNGSIQYNASTYSQLTVQSNFQDTADYSVFAVVNLSNVTNGGFQTIYLNSRGTSGETRSPNFGAGWSIEFNADGTNRMIDGAFIGTGRLQTALISSSSALTAYTNSSVYGSATNGVTRDSTDVGPLPMIGGAFQILGTISDNRFATGYFHEILFYNSALTTTQRQTIEGYLSKKWGIGSSSSIPSTHPFSSIRPHLRTFQPIDVPGCQLWLDGADQSSMTLSGSSVVTILDKSGNGFNLTGGSGWTYNVTKFNSSYPSFYRATKGSMLGQNNTFSITSSNITVFFVGQVINTSGQYYLVDGGSAGTNRFYTIIDTSTNIVHGNTVNADNNYSLPSTVFQPFIFSQSTGTSPQTGSYNGTAINASAGTVGTITWNGITVGGRFTNASDWWSGHICEVIIYNTLLTTSQRQQVEGYLAHKWGLSPSLPVISPLSIPGCQLWFDAADSSTVAFSSGSNISSWTNKGIVSTTAIPTRGPSGNQITYVTVDTYRGVYINNNGSVGYNSSTYSQLTVQSNFQTTADYSVFAVVNLSNVPAGEYQTIYANARGTSGETRTPNFGAGMSLEFNGDGANRMINGAFIGTGRLQTALISSSSALTAYTNTTAYGSVTNGFTRVSTDVGALPMIGGTFGAVGGGSDNRFATGYFHEILFYNSVLTTAQRQQIEGYLARKWGISISATLPSPHPFKSFPPASLPFSPRNISGLALWLDGADQSSLTLSGSNVTQWRDKSGNGYIMTNNAGTTTLATASLNSLSTVYTPSGTNTRITNFVGRTKCTIFIVAKAATSRYLLALNGGVLYTANDSLLYFQPPAGNYLDITDAVGLGTPVVSNNTWFILCIGYDNATNNTANPYTINGTTRSTIITPRGTPGILTDQNITSTFYINSVNGTNSYDSVYTAEILYYNSTLTTSERQQVEGYLAQKWGLTTSLPATHPYVKLPA